MEAQLRKAIVSSEFKPGERLPGEAELAATFQVSRATVREALRSLAASGLIRKQVGPAGGSFVETMDHESLRTMLSGSLETILSLGTVSFAETMDVRRMLEVPAVRLAATNRTEEQAAELERLVDRQEELEREVNDAAHDLELFGLGMCIYSLIAAASGNRALAAFVSALNRVTLPIYLRELKPDEAKVAAGHTRSLVQAIVSKDPDAAEKTITAQLDLMHRDRPRSAVQRKPRRPAANRRSKRGA
ncbi:FadR/GntR family transcriptional regulator [Mycobacterium kyogaense]|uniref:FadR/GntR family transcriptional regulator n=1 Tax=Mycobacterium kyogaense TaxID=2212479 RepID=UPI0013C45729|nr:FCD domain-containing protein [Mycobacterium kyogaense]